MSSDDIAKDIARVAQHSAEIQTGDFLAASKADTLSTLTEAYATMAHAYTALMTDGKVDRYDLDKAKTAMENIAKEISRVALAAEGNE